MKCFHHNDCDGRAAGAVVAMFEDNFEKENFFECDYINNLIPVNKISKGEKVYIVDYSISENTVETLKKIMSITDDIIWIDHHQSSVNMLNKHPEFKSIKGVVQEGISGAALSYMYLYNKKYEDIPLYLKYVSDFDCWHLKMPNIKEFKYGFECYDYGPLDDFWLRMEDNDKGDSNKFLQEVIDKGTIAKQYCEKDFERYRKSNAYETNIEGHKALVINIDSFSDVFGPELYNYDICLIWSYDGKNYSYSIYSEGKVDVSKIAEKYKGGGHPGCAGFSSSELLFK